MAASHMVDYLLANEDVEIYGLIRHSSTDNTWRLKYVMDKIELINGDMTDSMSLHNAIQKVRPDYVFNFAAQTVNRVAWQMPTYTFNVNTMGLLRLLEAIHDVGKKTTRIYQASSSEMFGNTTTKVQNEDTPLSPRSPYGISKATAHWIAREYRRTYKMFIATGIAYNFDSHRRSQDFFSRKVALGVARISLGRQKKLTLGDLESRRDMGFAEDFIPPMWKMLQRSKPDDYILATGLTHTMREFVETAFAVVGIHNWQDYVEFDARFTRPPDATTLVGDASKARKKLGWRPNTSFGELVRTMVETDLERLQRGDQL